MWWGRQLPPVPALHVFSRKNISCNACALQHDLGVCLFSVRCSHRHRPTRLSIRHEDHVVGHGAATTDPRVATGSILHRIGLHRSQPIRSKFNQSFSALVRSIRRGCPTSGFRGGLGWSSVTSPHSPSAMALRAGNELLRAVGGEERGFSWSATNASSNQDLEKLSVNLSVNLSVSLRADLNETYCTAMG